LFALDQHKGRRRFYLLTFLASLYPLFYSYSRGAYVAVLFALTVLGVLRFRPILIVSLVLVLFWDSILPDTVVERIQSTESEEGEIEQSAATRLELWQLAGALFLENPVFGIGFSGFFFATEGMALRNVHNYFYQTAAEQGIVGCLILGAAFMKAWGSGWKLYKQGTSGFQSGLGLGFIACVSAVMFTNLFGDRFSQLEVGAYFWLLFGIVDRINADSAVRDPVAEDASAPSEVDAVALNPQSATPGTPALPGPASTEVNSAKA
jgi:putative inorganic carbon (hco3(-)) transporter